MTEHIPTPLATRRLVTKVEELRRKREGTRDPITMVGQTSPEGAALLAHRASPDKVTDAQPIAIGLLKNEAPPKFKAAREFTTEKPQGDGEDHAGLVEVRAGEHSPPHEPTSPPTRAEPLPPGKEATSEARNLKQRQPHSRRLAANEIGAAVANPRRKNRRRGSRNPPQNFRLIPCCLSSTPSGGMPLSLSGTKTRRAFTARR